MRAATSWCRCGALQGRRGACRCGLMRLTSHWQAGGWAQRRQGKAEWWDNVEGVSGEDRGAVQADAAGAARRVAGRFDALCVP
jgi:hypothetical protein